MISFIGAAVVGVLSGAAVNATAYGLPTRLQRQWQAVGLPDALDAGGAPLRLQDALPWRAGKPGEQLQAWFVTFAALLGALACVYGYGWEWQSVWLYSAYLALLALVVIDLRTLLLPDAITLPLVWAGLLFHALFYPWELITAVYGAAFGYITLWLPSEIVKVVTGKTVMGHGDFKLNAALGAWLGVGAMPGVFLVAGGGFVLVAGLLALMGRVDRQAPLPFGPWLIVGGIIQFVINIT